MPTLPGLGPVFAYEWSTRSRRWQMYAVRSLFVAVLFVAVWLVWWNEVAGRKHWESLQAYARAGEKINTISLCTLLGMVLVVSPTLSAGAVCQDKARGPLLHLLSTSVSDGEIILGKLGARMVPLIGLIACTAPVMFLGTLFGGIDPDALIGAFLVILAIAVFNCTLALTLSVWAKRTFEVLLLVYLFWVVLILGAPIAWILKWNWDGKPIGFGNESGFSVFQHLLNMSFGSQESGLRVPVIILGVTIALCAGLVLIAKLSLRPATLRQAARPGRQRVGWTDSLPGWYGIRWLPAPSLEGNPVTWREWKRQRPTLITRIAWVTYLLLAGFITYFVYNFAEPGMTKTGATLPSMANTALVTLGLLLLCVTSTTSLIEERTRGTLDLLLITPLSTWSIVWGKWWGAYRTVPPLLVFPAILTYLATVRGSQIENVFLITGLMLAYGAAITSLGLVTAAWIPRPHWALPFSLSVFLLVNAAFVPQLFFPTLFGRATSFLSGASPFHNVRKLTGFSADEDLVISYFVETGTLHFDADAIALFWMIFYFWLAMGLFVLLLFKFDTYLGRMRGAVLRD